DRRDPVARDRNERTELHGARVLCRESHGRIDVRAQELRVVEPCVRETLGLGDLTVAPGVDPGWKCDSEMHEGSPPSPPIASFAVSYLNCARRTRVPSGPAAAFPPHA